MSKNDMAVEAKRKIREARLVIVAEYYSKGHSYRKIREEVMKRLKIDQYSLRTVKRDIDTLLEEWRSERLDDTEDAVVLLLERNRQHYQEVREEWERSRKDRTKTDTKKKGKPVEGGKKSDDGSPSGKSEEATKIKTILTEEKRITELGEGDPRYMDLMIKLEDQRAKILGVYVEKHSLFGPNGEPLGSGSPLDLNKLTDEEKERLLQMARKIE